jgi:hypothetical protein
MFEQTQSVTFGCHTRLTVRLPVLALVLAFAALAPSRTAAESFCVSTSGELRAALAAAQGNGEADTVTVVQGTYLTGGVQFEYFTAEGFGLVMLGGYDPGCSAQTLDPANTILDGEQLSRVVRLLPDNFTSGILVFRGFTVRNGFTTGFDGGAGLAIGGSMGHSGDVTVDHCIIIDNHTDYIGGGLNGGSDTGVTRIENNLIVNNSALIVNGGASLTSNGTAYITSNTVSGNTAPEKGGLRLGGSATGVHSIANNIFFGNADADLVLDSAAITVQNSNFGTLFGTPGPGSGGNLSVDPMFVGGGDFHLLLASPVINQGTNLPPGGLSTTDLDGLERMHDGIVDMGAYEHQGQPDAVELVSLRVIPGTDAIRLVWTATFESDLLGFHVHRSSGAHGSFEQITRSLIDPPGPYEFIDTDVVPGTSYLYQLVALSRSGGSERFEAVAGRLLDVARLTLSQNTPNPCFSSASETTIRFDLARPSRVTLDVFDTSGRQIRRLVDDVLGVGTHAVEWNGRDDGASVVGAGVYYYRVAAGGFSVTRRLVHLQ